MLSLKSSIFQVMCMPGGRAGIMAPVFRFSRYSEYAVTPPPYELIDSAGAWRQCLRTLRSEARFAVDVEANSLYAYRERICLLQISIPDHDFIIDPLAGFSLEDMGKLLSNPRIEKVFHASDYDLMLLKRHYGWTVSNLFDTMWAGRILGFNNMGLAWFLHEFFGLTLSKRHQRANWAVRPLPEELLLYARMDTHYLLALRDQLAARLEEAGRFEEAREIFDNECRVHPSEQGFDPEAYRAIRGARELTPRGLAVLRSLYLFRDKEARRRDVPPFKVIGNEALMQLARHAPATLDELRAMEGFSRRLAERMGPRLITIIAQGKKAAPPGVAPKRYPKKNPEESARYKALFEWRRKMAQARGVESDVIITRETMWEIARNNPLNIEELSSITSLGPHRRDLYGKLILAVLRSEANAFS